MSLNGLDYLNVSLNGTLNIDNLSGYNGFVSFDTKGTTTLANCTTIGTEATATGNVIPTGITFASNSQNGYTINSSSIGRYSYPAYYAFNNGTYAWWSSQNSYDSGGNPSGAYYIDHQAGRTNGDWVSISFPYYLILSNVSFYNDDGFFFNYTARTVAVYGQYDNGIPILLRTYGMAGNPPAQNTYSFTISTTTPFNKFYFQVTLMSSNSGGECSIKNIIYTGKILNKTITENIYFPQSIEVGRTATNTALNTDVNLLVNGNSTINGDTTILNKMTVGANLSVGGTIDVLGHVFRSVYAMDILGAGGTTVAGQCFCNYGTITIASDTYGMFVQASGMKAPRTGFYLVCFDARLQDTTNLITFAPRVWSGSAVYKDYQDIFVPGDNYPRRSITWSNVIYMPAGAFFQPLSGYACTMFGWNFSGCYLGE